MTLTDLQRFILSLLVENGKVDPDPADRPMPALLGNGLTAADIEDRAGGWYGRATIVRALNQMCRPTAGNADNPPRKPWCRQITGAIAKAGGVPETGPGRQWVATPDGAAQVQA